MAQLKELIVNGASKLLNTLTVNGATNIIGTANISGTTTLESELIVNGISELSDTLTVNGAANITGVTTIGSIETKNSGGLLLPNEQTIKIKIPRNGTAYTRASSYDKNKIYYERTGTSEPYTYIETTNVDSSNYQNYYTAVGWAGNFLKFIDNVDNDFAHIGIYGTGSTLKYIYIGSGDYNSTDNLRITPSGDVTAKKFIGPLEGSAEYLKAFYASGDAKNEAITKAPGDGLLHYYYSGNKEITGLFPTSNNANAILTLSRHNGNYYSQLGFSGNGNIYYRSFSAAALDTTTGWKAILDSSNYTTYTVTKTGGGASGNSWAIGITGNAATATTASKVTQTNVTNTTDTYRAVLLSGDCWDGVGAAATKTNTDANKIYYDAPTGSDGYAMGLGFNPKDNTLYARGTFISDTGTANTKGVYVQYNGNTYGKLFVRAVHSGRLYLGNATSIDSDSGASGTLLLYGDTDNYLSIAPGAITEDITIGATTSASSITTLTINKGLTISSGNLTLSSGVINQSSDKNVKYDIQSIPKVYEQFYNNLQPKQFKYNYDTTDRNRFGFIAQEVEEAYKNAELDYQDDAIIAKRDNDEQGEWDLNMMDIVPLNTWQIQQMKQEIELLKMEIVELRKLVKKNG